MGAWAWQGLAFSISTKRVTHCPLLLTSCRALGTGGESRPSALLLGCLSRSFPCSVCDGGCCWGMALSHGVWREDNPSVSTVLPQDPGPGNLGAAGGGEAAVSPSSYWSSCPVLGSLLVSALGPSEYKEERRVLRGATSLCPLGSISLTLWRDQKPLIFNLHKNVRREKYIYIFP